VPPLTYLPRSTTFGDSSYRLSTWRGSLRYVVGTWNLEHFHEKATGGFPESHKWM